jgi:hypothetical protein
VRWEGKRAPTWRVTTVAVLNISFHAERRISVGLMSQDHYQVPRAGQQSRQATRGCTDHQSRLVESVLPAWLHPDGTIKLDARRRTPSASNDRIGAST